MLISVFPPPHHPTTMSSAGPSQRRRRGSIDESQSQRPTQTQDGTHARRKRPRGSLREELFDKPDLEEKARIVAGYRDMQMAADGELNGLHG